MTTTLRRIDAANVPDQYRRRGRWRNSSPIPLVLATQRESLLKRFEELVFYDGKPVFLKPETLLDGEETAGTRAGSAASVS